MKKERPMYWCLDDRAQGGEIKQVRLLTYHEGRDNRYADI
jgi:hypothetical protein